MTLYVAEARGIVWHDTLRDDEFEERYCGMDYARSRLMRRGSLAESPSKMEGRMERQNCFECTSRRLGQNRGLESPKRSYTS
jgi:hypothetical protein